MTILGKIYPIKWMFLLVWCALALVGCQAEGEYSTWPCRFGYDNAIHQDATLATAMNVASRGCFARLQNLAFIIFFKTIRI